MNLSQEKALYHLTGQLKPNGDSFDQIQKLANTYPYFAPVQSLLAYHYKLEEHPMVVLQTLKTAIYYTNPYWLQFQLQGNNEDYIKHNKAPLPELTSILTNFVEGSENVPIVPLYNDTETAKPESQIPFEAPIVNLPNLTPEESLKDIEQESFKEPSSGFSLISPIDIPTVEAVKEILRKIDAPEETFSYSPSQPPINTGNQDDLAEAYPPNNSWVSIANEQEELEKASDNKISSLLSTHLSDFKKPVDPKAKLDIEGDNELLFTVDYFASQGIIIDLNQVTQDKLTIHLLKFTDWLKQMKQGELNPKDLLANRKMEQIVVMNAQISNEKGEIITEAMAEVLIKQGQIGHAILLYQKLSFLNPEKSSYFASKIEQLKVI